MPDFENENLRNPVPSFRGAIFGDGYGDTIQEASFHGMPGWFTVPGSWVIEDNGPGQMFVTSPTDGRRYNIKLDWDGRLKFQSLMPPV